MNRDRYKITSPSGPSDQCTRWKVTDIKEDGSAELIGNVVQENCTVVENVRQQMIDEKSEPYSQYNHCTNCKNEAFYYATAGVGDSGELGICAQLPLQVDDYILQQLRTDGLIRNSNIYVESLGETLIDVGNEFPTKRPMINEEKLRNRELIFSNRTIPHSIHIKFDPYDTDFSVWFAIVDVIQLKGLWRGLFSARGNLGRLRDLSLQSNRATAKQLADDHLAVSFGLIPTFADIKKFISLIKTWTDIYDSKEVAAKRRYWHEPVTDLKRLFPDRTLEGTTPVDIHPDVGFALDVQCRITTEVARVNRTCSYTYLAPEFHGFLSRLKQFIDAFGILDPAALWDVVPFTFIVDWFIGIGSWLHKNRPKLFPVDVLIRDYCESFKLVQVHAWYVHSYNRVLLGSFSDAHEVRNQLLGVERHTTYLRRRFRPSAADTLVPKINTEIISVRRALISASLVAQRIPR
jgi:hypothetical protein